MDKLRALTFFCRVAESKSFSAAARSVGVPTSVLSKTIAALEHDLEFALLRRSTRQLSLTEAGRKYYQQCREIMTDLEEAESTARDSGNQPVGLLRIGIHPVFRDSLYARIGEFLKAQPKLTVEISHTNLPTALIQDGLDIVLRVGEMPDSNFASRKLGSLSLITCASPTYLAELGRPTHPRDLVKLRAVIPGRHDEESFVRWTFTKGRKRETISVPVCLVLREGIGLGLTTLGGVGVVRLYDFAARPFIDAGTLVPILDDWMGDNHPIYAVMPLRKQIPVKTRAFVEFAQTLLSSEQVEAL
jgi:LysR family transcriptional regulator, regulator for bpeEF and oprC